MTKPAYHDNFKRIIITLFHLASIVFLSTTAALGQQFSNIDNPVLPGVADAGVIRFNGKYYIGGVFTNGSFYVSKDLVHWDGPVHVFSMDNDWTDGPSADDSQIHANDINYVNGVFHQYWSVNYWGKDQHVVHIGHATSADILGPYKEPVKDTWLDNRIDPELFIDDDGTPYLYMVKFTDGNTIWGRRMKDPGTFASEPTYLFSSLPNTWETIDNRVAEGPSVIKYRNKYYMMYNTNHTSTRWGNYALGVAVADSPLGFNHGSKYLHPVVKSNQIELEEKFVDVLSCSPKESQLFTYTFTQPDKNWVKPTYNGSGWKKGKTGFGSTVVKNSTARNVRTMWQSPQIWVRKTFQWNGDNGNPMLRIHHDGETTVYLNGEVIYEAPGNQYITWNLDQNAQSLLKDGANVLAIHSAAGERTSFLDASLFDMKNKKGDDILYSPGQPNLVRGPNGFEWWLVYMANKNAERRGQYINRVHFFEKKLFVDGITGIKTDGYHPPPTQPLLSDVFDDAKKLSGNWQLRAGTWQVKEGEVVQTAGDVASALVRRSPATHYIFESGIKLNANDAKAGVYAWWHDDQHWLKILFDPEQKSWGYVVKSGVKEEKAYFPLPAHFKYNVYHTLRIEKNAADFSIRIDDLPAPRHPVLTSALCAGKGIPGLYTEDGNASFDGVLYSIGWDEFDDCISGWSDSNKGDRQKGTWSISENGIGQNLVVGESAIFKGDMLDEYELSLQITAEKNTGTAGIFPIYIDADNYVKAVFDFKNQQLSVSGRKNGLQLEPRKLSLEGTATYYADMRYTDFIEKHFTLDAITHINAIHLNKAPHNQPDTAIDEMHTKVNIFYRSENKWHPLTDYKVVPSDHPGFEKIGFDPVKAGAFKFVNSQADDHAFYIYKIGVNELFKQSYNLRVAKHMSELVFIVDGKEVMRMKHDYPASQVGLVTENAKAFFNGITFFQLNGARGQ